MIIDKTGRKLKIGQTVDIVINGVFPGKIIGIKDQPIILSSKQQLPPHLVVALTVTPVIHPNGLVDMTYIIAEPDPNDPIVKESEGRKVSLYPS